MAEHIQPPIVGEIQQSLEVPQGGQAEGNVGQGSFQSLPPPVPPVPNQPPSNDHQPQGGNENHNSLNIARFIVEILTLLVLLWYTIITNGLWRVADQANRLNIENARLDQRAWVGLGPINILNKMTTSEPFRINARVGNSGNSPALNFLAFSKLAPLRTADGDERVPFLEQPDFAPCVGPNPQWRDGLRGTVMMPGAQVDSLDGFSDIPAGKFVGIVTAHTDQKGVPLPPEDLTVVPLAPGTPAYTKIWQFRLYFVGCLNYFDIFHEAHRTSFCFRYVPSNTSPIGTFGACANGNSAD